LDKEQRRMQDGSMLDRRQMLGALGAPALWGALGPPPASPSLREVLATPGAPEVLAEDEDFWRPIQAAFPADRSMVNFNNGGVCPSPTLVQESLRRHLEFANGAPAYKMWRLQEPQKETIRASLARLFGADTEEIAITRNTSESLQICQFGLDLQRGDHVLTSNQDYPRMIATFRQRVRREGLVLRKVSLPVPAEDPAEVVRRFEGALTERTKLILACHMVNLTGQVLPVRELVELGRRHAIPVLVDGAHAFAHFPFRQADLGCEYYGSSLHKWLFAPFGTGLLYVRKERIEGLWPLMAADESLDGDIRKFEQIGTHSVPVILAIADALGFHEALGAERKAARLVYLRDRWARRLAENERVVLNTSLKPGLAYGIANVRLAGVDTAALRQHLWSEHRIYTIVIKHADFEGLRVSPAVYSTLEEVDRFADVLEDVLRDGLPG
jgi:selenocysteine lyase/cysteine desulfurase